MMRAPDLSPWAVVESNFVDGKAGSMPQVSHKPQVTSIWCFLNAFAEYCERYAKAEAMQDGDSDDDSDMSEYEGKSSGDDEEMAGHADL